MQKTRKHRKAKNKTYFKKTMKTYRRGGFLDKYLNSTKTTTPTTTPETVPSSAINNNQPNTANANVTKSKGFSSTSDYVDYAKNTLKSNRSAMNMPATLAAINSKINALLIHNKVNYKFSNGYTARDYNIENVVAESYNEGRGELIPNASRGKITGVQSGVYNKGMDTYSNKNNKSLNN